jgi:hypothetical protein
MAEWLMGQNAEAGESKPVPKYIAMMPENDTAIEIWTEYHPELEPILEAANIVPWMIRWMDEQTQRPAVLSYADFNTWAQVSHELIFTKVEGLIAYEQVVKSRLHHTFELMRIIKADEWEGFFERYGGVGVIAGVVDQKMLDSAPRTWQGALKDPESVRVVYYFSEAQEAAFARIAF